MGGTVAAAVGTAQRSDDGNLVNPAQQVKRRVGQGIQIVFFGIEDDVFSKNASHQLENLLFTPSANNEIRPRICRRMIMAKGGILSSQDDGNARQHLLEYFNHVKNPGIPVGHHGRDQHDIRIGEACNLFSENGRIHSISAVAAVNRLEAGRLFNDLPEEAAMPVSVAFGRFAAFLQHERIIRIKAINAGNAMMVGAQQPAQV